MKKIFRLPIIVFTIFMLSNSIQVQAVENLHSGINQSQDIISGEVLGEKYDVGNNSNIIISTNANISNALGKTVSYNNPIKLWVYPGLSGGLGVYGTKLDGYNYLYPLSTDLISKTDDYVEGGLENDYIYSFIVNISPVNTVTDYVPIGYSVTSGNYVFVTEDYGILYRTIKRNTNGSNVEMVWYTVANNPEIYNGSNGKTYKSNYLLDAAGVTNTQYVVSVIISNYSTKGADVAINVLGNDGFILSDVYSFENKNYFGNKAF